MFSFRDDVMCGQTLQVLCVKIMKSIVHKNTTVKLKVCMQTGMAFSKATDNI